MPSLWIHVMSNGDIYAGDTDDKPTSGTILATFTIQAGQALRKLGTLSGTANSNLTSSGHNGRTNVNEK